MTINATLKTAVQALLSGVNEATPIHELFKLKVLSDGLSLDKSALRSAIADASSDVDSSSSLPEVFALTMASKRQFSGGIRPGETTLFPSSTPPRFEQSEAVYLREGYFETEDYDPSIQPIVNNTLGAVQGGAVAAYGINIANMGRHADSDGAGLWIAYFDGTGAYTMRSTDDGVTWNSIEAGVLASSGAQAYVKHISGVGAASVWMIQTTNFTKRSVDGGVSWNTVATASGATTPWIVVNGATVLIASSSANYRRSTNSGLTFGSDITLPGTSPVHRNCIHTAGNKFVIAGQATIASLYRPVLWVSENDGVSFGSHQNLNGLIAALGDLQVAAQSLAYSPLYGRLYVTVGADVGFGIIIKTFTTSTVNVLQNGYFTAKNVQTSVDCIKASGDGVLVCMPSSGSQPVQFIEMADESMPLLYAMPCLSGSLVGLANKGAKFLFMPTSRVNTWRGVRAAGINPAFGAGTTTSDHSPNVSRYMRIK